ALAVFAGKYGTNVNGVWRLRAVDSATFDIGTIQCWSLMISSAGCTPGGGECPGADLAIGITSAPEPVIVGNNLTYTISVTNHGPTTAKNVIASQVLPGSVIFVSASSSQGNCSQSGGIVTCSFGTLPAGAYATATIVVLPASVGLITTTATVRAD